MKIGFTGHRDKKCNPAQLDLILKEFPDAIWVTGGAVGFDNQVEEFAKGKVKENIIIRPDYAAFKSKAPLVRNIEIVDQSDLLYACYDGRQRGGTFYTINVAKKLGKEVRFLSYICPRCKGFGFEDCSFECIPPDDDPPLCMKCGGEKFLRYDVPEITWGFVEV